MKRIIWLLFFCFPVHAFKILHISFHRGCINEFASVARTFSLDVTSWHIFTPEVYPRFSHEDRFTFNVLNITQEKARTIWEANKDFFESFDAIITSDTAPLSRIFLQNGWHKPLIIWVCNRFDCAHVTPGCNFPDDAYYQLFKQATEQPNVWVVPYTPFEATYAATKGIPISHPPIKPIGTLPQPVTQSAFSNQLNKKNLIFISQTGPAPLYKLEKPKINYIAQQCQARGIPIVFGHYNGADDLTGIKGVIHFPYQASNLMLFENLQRGIIHFVPSKKFIAMAQKSDDPAMPCRHLGHNLTSYDDSEWYNPEHASLFVYFDSWDDLKQKVGTIDYENKGDAIIAFARRHRETMLARWKQIFDTIRNTVPSPALSE